MSELAKAKRRIRQLEHALLEAFNYVNERDEELERSGRESSSEMTTLKILRSRLRIVKTIIRS